MKINSREKAYKGKGEISSFIDYLSTHENNLSLIDSNLYYDFPVFKDFDGDLLISQILILSRQHGIVIVTFDNGTILPANDDFYTNLEQLHSVIFSRLLRNKSLRKTKTELIFPINSFVFNTSLSKDIEHNDVFFISNFKSLDEFLSSIRILEIDSQIYNEIISTIEGSKGMIKPKERGEISSEKIKGYVANEIEKEINSFDEYQKKAYMNEIIGPERVRGLAGSGKTVVLALKAAITHLRYPDAEIIYTFYTKSLYQHIQRLITRFYRQYDDKDPNWDKLRILHAWGSNSNRGVYYEACEINEEPFFSFSNAQYKSPSDPFGFACDTILKNPNLVENIDYIFIDEGQDFPESFIKLCLRICKGGKIVWAYDELQTIFQTKTPKIESILTGSEFHGPEEDIILYKCYRNPREVLLTAHAIGFGIYGKIVQMVDDKEYWNDIGYKLKSGNLEQGSNVVIERPKENSLETISNHFNIDEIIKYIVCVDMPNEIDICVENIVKDIENGLLPDDILVIVADDRYAREYLSSIQHKLSKRNIKSNNIHSDKFNIKDFNIDKHVTLSTIHKAKGNEAFSVYVVGTDSLYSLIPSVRERNLMFTAITRTKGWVTISGIGSAAQKWADEINTAKLNFPDLKFVYPSKHEMKIMERDLQESALRKSKQAKILDELLSDMSPEEIKLFLEQRELKSKKK